MSLTFSITPPTRFLRRHRAMEVGEVLELREPDLLLPAAEDEVEEVALWRSSLDDLVVLGGSFERSGRGFELSYERGAYRLRQFTPSTLTDWRIALDLLAALARHVGADIVSEDGTTFTAETITDFDARADITAGLRAMSAQAHGHVTMPGYVRPVTLSAKTWQRVLQADDPPAAFSEEFDAVQRVEAFDASQMVRQDPETEDAVGVYVLTEGVHTVLPRDPVLEPGLREQMGGDVSTWELVLLEGDEDPEPVGAVPYEEGFRRLPAQKLRDIDAASVLVDALDGQEIRQAAGLDG